MASHSGQHQQRERVDIDTTISYLRGEDNIIFAFFYICRLFTFMTLVTLVATYKLFFTLGEMPFKEYSALLERLGDESDQTDANMEVDIGLNAEVNTAAVEKGIHFSYNYGNAMLCCCLQ
jgi:hypothetical protein